MRPVEIESEQIIQAGKDLVAAGRNITGFALRQRVGGGNPNRLKQVWNEYLSSQSMATAEPVAELPVEVADEVAAVTKALTERIAALAIELNDKAVKAAERRVSEVVRAAGEQREQAERELADASQTVDDLEAKLDELQAEKDAISTSLADEQASRHAQAVELAQVRERLSAIEQSAKTAAEQHAAELAKNEAAIELERGRHQHEVEQLRADLAEQIRATQAGAVELAQVHERLSAVEQSAKTAAEQHAAELAKNEAAIEVERGRHQHEVDRLRAELATVKAKAEAAEQMHQEQRKSAAQESHRVAERLKDAKTDRDSAKKAAAAAREEMAGLRGQVETLQTQVSELLKLIGKPPDASSPELQRTE